jgi:hypothetical protein
VRAAQGTLLVKQRNNVMQCPNTTGRPASRVAALLVVSLLWTFATPAQAGYQQRSLGNLLDLLRTVFTEDGILTKEALAPLAMLELGNQEIHDYQRTQPYPIFDHFGFNVLGILDQSEHTLSSQTAEHPDYFSTRPFFHHMGILDYTSIDYNGDLGAIKADVRHDIGEVLSHRQFDIVTNTGFSEHVGEYDTEANLAKNQYAVFKNLHDAGKAGAVYFHDVPFKTSFHRHGMAHYDASFFRALIERNGYRQCSLFVTDYSDDHTVVVVATYQKLNNDAFMTFEAFAALPGMYSRYEEFEATYFTFAYENRVDSLTVLVSLTISPEELAADPQFSMFSEKDMEGLLGFIAADREFIRNITGQNQRESVQQ